MENKLRNYLNSLFTKARDGEMKDEILQELYTNLCEKYNDLISQGKAPDEAYAETIDGIGDVAEIISFINANSGSDADFDFSTAFDGFEGRMRDLAKSFEAPLREVANDLKNAAMSARDAIKDTKGPLKEMAKQMSSDVKEAVSHMESSNPSRGTYRYDYEIPADGIESINVTTVSGKVTFGVSQNENIYVVELARAALDEDKRANIDRRGGTLYISHGKNQVGFFFFGIGVYSSDFEIYLPKKAFENISVKTSSGEVDLDVDLNSRNIEIRTTSGDIDGKDIFASNLTVSTTSGEVTLTGLNSNKAAFSSVSGDMQLSGEVDECTIKTTSGEIEVNGSVREIEVSTVSGDMELDGAFESLKHRSTSGDAQIYYGNVPFEMNITTVSGDVKIAMPESDGFTLNYKRISGGIKSDFNLMTSLNSKSGTAVYRDGELRTYSIYTTSGDIKLLKR